MMPKVGIIAPFGVHCGIARAGQVSKDIFQGLDIELIDLDLCRKILIHNGTVTAHKVADEYIESLIRNANECDLIIWQHEPGTLGRNWRQQLKFHSRFSKIRKPMIVELHTVVDINHSSILKNQLNCIRNYLKNPKKVKLKWELSRSTARTWFWKSIYRDLARITSRSGLVIVHREIDKRILSSFASFQTTPLVLELDSLTGKMRNLSENPPDLFESIELLRIDSLLVDSEQKFLMVQPGFISRYKGHLTAIEALKVLPDFVHLIILGEIHEVVADATTGTSSMTSEIQEKLLEKDYKSIRNRVHFVPTPSDLEIAAAIYSSDAVILPYLETGQSGSGPLSESCLLGAQVICSNIPAFRGRERFGRNLHFFDVGNIFQVRDLVLMLNALRQPTKIGRRRIEYPWSIEPEQSSYRESVLIESRRILGIQ